MEHNHKSSTAEGVRVDERIIPVPASISTEAQAMLRAAVRDDGTPLNALYPLPAPEDHEAWRRLQIAADAHYADALRGATDETKVAIETLRLGTATVHVATPNNLRFTDCVFIDLHGGALVFGGGDACRESARLQADRHGMVCYGIDYRMPPDHPFPAALDDCMAVYRHVIDQYGAGRVLFGGRSAGGNLAMATILRARDEGMPSPAGVVLLSPQVDLTESGDSFQTNRTVDVVLPNSLMSNNLLYADGAELSHPYLSPLFGEMSAEFPPIFLQSGTRDLFLSNTVRLHRKLRRVGVPVELHVFEAMPHGGFAGAPEDLELAAEVVRFVMDCLPPAVR
ncbi:esterase [Ensifer sp. NM-2]|uniref:alpha/beta hydrolase n=1 Tax=Ensifer sp. NM-2 TaxID=2109730 RepID=UPI000D139342|nr:alpha/beta hydrolase [Ensifer sp. NM-2]PSS60507.1 esterase [Ensifer sp. NM-2]